MAIKAGTVAFVKTTQEPVFVLDVVENAGGHGIAQRTGLTNTMAVVRRPKMTRDGCVHEETNFYVEELESEEESAQRRINERVKEASALRAQFGLGDDEPKAVPPVVN